MKLTIVKMLLNEFWSFAEAKYELVYESRRRKIVNYRFVSCSFERLERTNEEINDECSERSEKVIDFFFSFTHLFLPKSLKNVTLEER